MQRRLTLLLVPLLAATLWGCGSNRDSDSSTTPTVSVEEAEKAGNCTICHTIDVHAFSDQLVGQNVGGLGSDIEHDCEDCHGGGQYHHGVGPIPFPEPNLARCNTCHEGVENVPASAHATVAGMNCLDCHDPLQAETFESTALPGEMICADCHNAAPTAENVFSAEIYSRFETSRHANQSARTALCSACHSHEGGVEFLAMGRKISRAELSAAYTAETVPDVYQLPVGSDTIDGVMKKNCATCHDQHAAKLRGDGDITAAMLGETGTTTQEATVVYSAEFNLCTACHMVDVVAEKTGTAGAGYLLYDYQLSDKYTSANLVDASTETFDLTKAPFYHDGASGNGRTMVDTHFGGTIMQHLVQFDGSAADIEIKGYNINAGAQNACTTCHDPHTAGKMLGEVGGTFEGADNITNPVIAYAQGLGDFHNSYQTTVAYRQSGCAPCHTGDNFASVTEGVAPNDDWKWGTIGCRSCHDLAQPNTGPGANNSPAFAEVREFPVGYEFKFNEAASSTYEPDTYAQGFPPFNGTLDATTGEYTATPAAVVTAIELGDNQVCFECHKGRTPGVMPPTENAAGTMNYSISYLHYAPSMGILFGNDSKMVLTYPGKTYAGRFEHPNSGAAADGIITEFGCTDCHDVHNTEGNHAYENRMVNPAYTCSSCHTEENVATLQARTQAFSERLLATVLNVMKAVDTTVAPGSSLNANLKSKIVALQGSYPNANYATAEEELMAYIQERQVYFPSRKVAHAAATWKVFTYEDGAPHGQTHGHGGSWAHNSKFARQVMYDAIESLSGDLTGLTRP